MKEFLKRIFIYSTFLLFFFPLTFLIYHLVDKASHFDTLEDSDLVTKFHYLKKNKADYSAVFVGSSMVYRHINTAVFDSICQTRSFNLGSGGFSPVRSFDLLEQLYTENLGIDYLFFELSRFETLKKNFNTTPSIRSMSWKYYGLILSSLYKSEYTFFRKAQYFVIYTSTLLYKYFGTGVLSQISRPHKTFDIRKQNPLLRNNGFYSLTDYVNENNDDAAMERNTRLVKNPRILNILSRINTFDKPEGYFPQRSAYSDYMNDLHERFLKNGTQLFFIINPRKFDKNDVKFLNQVAFYLPESSVLFLDDPREFPEFYEFKYSFDQAHFNREGADLYTKQLAILFNKIKQGEVKESGTVVKLSQ